MSDLAFRQIVQVTVVALLAIAAMRWACRRRPHLAYVLGLIVLIKCWTPPIWSSRGGVFCWPPVSRGTIGQTQSLSEPVRRHAPAMAVTRAVGSRQLAEKTRSEYRSAVTLTAPIAEPDWPQSLAGWLVATWLAGALTLVCAMAIRWRLWYCGITSAAAPPGNRLLRQVAEIARQIGLRRVPRLVVTTSDGGPAVYGLWRPSIVLSHRLLTADQAENLRMVLTHEMLHVRRGDLYVSLFQFVTLAAWWFHPAIWWICRRLTQERERSCDEELLAVSRCSAGAYAQCLLDTLRQKRQEMVPAFAGMRAVDVTQQRIEHIMLSGGIARQRTPLRYWLLAAVALLVILPGQRFNLAISDEAPHAKREIPALNPNADKPAATREVAGKGDKGLQEKDARTPRSERLERAIHLGIGYLKSEQLADGHWTDPVGYPGGITSLCTLTLLKWGMTPDERAAASALKYLRAIKPNMTYSTSLQTLVFCAAGGQAERKLIQRNVDWLVKAQKVRGQYTGAWGYPQAEGDNSNTAFAVWALSEADRAGVAVDMAVWRRVLNYWLNQQNADGSWGYKPQLLGTGSMTSQGLFCVAAAAKKLGEDQPQQAPAKAIEKAATWLGKHFSVQQNPGSRGQEGWQLYYLLALGKAGRITGRDQFGDHRWPAEAADELLDKQHPDGSWKGAGHAEDDPHVATSLALLFLMEAH